MAEIMNKILTVSILGLAMLLFLLSCAYVPWNCSYYQSVFVHKTDTEHYLEYHLASPSETRFGWVFRRPVVPKSIFAPDGGVKLSAEVNVQLLLIEWLGICLFTGGMICLLKGIGNRSS
jgi:hypothetical protein